MEQLYSIKSDEPVMVSRVDYCGNSGCAANEDKKCIALTGGCYGYIRPATRKGGVDEQRSAATS